MIKIIESNEPLVNLKKLCPNFVIDLDASRMKKEKTAYLRKTVAKMLQKAEKFLPNGMTFIIGDAWRPQYVQRKIFKDFICKFTKKYPKWSEKRIIKEVEKYVAPADGKYASGHMTGGAVDLRLWKNDRKVPMKSSKLSYQENAKSIQSKLPVYLQNNRKIMFTALAKAGLSNYPSEYWHWSYGDIWWAERNHQKIAKYGVIKEVSNK
ncbi:MAG TPA: M15 family metallopeptidase [Patescibacteria group bacterium]|nr:M15 family metallopeptidase [Patescibacteria group bacterium]